MPTRTTGMSPQTIKRFKLHIIKNDLTISQAFAIALENFILFRKEVKMADKELPYYSPTRNSKSISGFVPSGLDEKIQLIVKEDEISIRKVLYTALYYYMNHKNLFTQGDIA